MNANQSTQDPKSAAPERTGNASGGSRRRASRRDTRVSPPALVVRTGVRAGGFRWNHCETQRDAP